MQNRTVVIAIEMSPSSPNYKGFKDKSAIDKIDFIAEEIEKAYIEAQKKHPNSAVIVGWEEYGITESFSPLVDIVVKNHLREKMSVLVEKLPLLSVYAGTIAVQRRLEDTEQKAITPDDKLARHLKYYEHPKVQQIQETEKTFKWWQNQHTHIQKNKISAVQNRKEKKNVKVVSNTLYSFRSKKEKDKQIAVVKKKRKMAAFRETITPFQIYRPGSVKTSDPYITETHPISGKEYDVFTDICYEHVFTHLKERKEPKRPKFQFVFSSSICLDPAQLIAEHVIHFDPKVKTSHIQLVESSKEDEVYVYRLKILDEKPTLIGPILPFNAVEHKIHFTFQQEISELKRILARFGNIYSMPLKELTVEFEKIKQEFPNFYAIYATTIETVLARNNERSLQDFALSIIRELQETVRILEKNHDEFNRKVSSGTIEELDSNPVYDLTKEIEKTYMEAEASKSKVAKFFSQLFASPPKIEKKAIIDAIEQKFSTIIEQHKKDPYKQFLNTHEDPPLLVEQSDKIEFKSSKFKGLE